MSGKTRPDTGVVLVAEPAQAARGKALGTRADLVSADGILATVEFESPWPLQQGTYYDVEVKSKEGGDGAFLVSKTPKSGSPASLPATWFRDAIFSIDGRYGAYGAPADVKLLRDEVIENDRLLEYSFTALSPSRAEVLRRCYVRATSAPGSKDVFAIVAGTTAARWRKEKGDETSRRVADSLRVTATKKTALKKDESSDYRTYKSKMPDLSRQKEGGNAKYGGDL